jgi:esterase
MPLFFREYGGSDGPPVVLVHGLFGSLENLAVLATKLADQFKVYSVDLPNHGRSPHSPSISLRTLANDLGQWLNEQNLHSAHFVGHSLGGKTVMELALTSPQRCLKLAVLDIAPVTYRPHHQAIFQGLMSIDLSRLTSRRNADDLLKPYVDDAAVRAFLLKNLVKTDIGFSWRMNLPVLWHDYQALIASNIEPAEPFKGEVLFVKGSDSPYIQEQHRAAILARFPNAKLRIIENTGHWLHAEKPRVIANLLARFLSA